MGRKKGSAIALLHVVAHAVQLDIGAKKIELVQTGNISSKGALRAGFVVFVLQERIYGVRAVLNQMFGVVKLGLPQS